MISLRKSLSPCPFECYFPEKKLAFPHNPSIGKDAGKTMFYIYHFRVYPIPSVMLYLSENQVRPKMACLAWSNTILLITELRKRLRSLVVDELFLNLELLSQRQNVSRLSLLCRYFHDKYSDELPL